MTTVLVIEDHDTLRAQLGHILQAADYDVLIAADGSAGIHAARACPPDVILCDIMLGETSGFDVLEQVREHPETSSTPFILMSARDDRFSIRHGMALGADDYITKPFTAGELVDAIEARLARRQTIAQEAERSLEATRQQLMRMVTHELRTPLTSVNMVVDIISRQRNVLDAAQLADLLDTLAAGSHRLSRLVDQIVLMSQLESGVLSQPVIAESGVDAPLREILVASVAVARRFAYRNPNVNVELSQHEPDEPVRCNPMALKHALAELVTNALNFSPDGSSISITQWAAEGSLFVEITDCGPGIAPEAIERALSRFEQIDRQTQEQQGLGLGLSLANQIITAHGGSLSLRSAPGKGTQATVALPLAVSVAL